MAYRNPHWPRRMVNDPKESLLTWRNPHWPRGILNDLEGALPFSIHNLFQGVRELPLLASVLAGNRCRNMTRISLESGL